MSNLNLGHQQLTLSASIYPIGHGAASAWRVWNKYPTTQNSEPVALAWEVPRNPQEFICSWSIANTWRGIIWEAADQRIEGLLSKTAILEM